MLTLGYLTDKIKSVNLLIKAVSHFNSMVNLFGLKALTFSFSRNKHFLTLKISFNNERVKKRCETRCTKGEMGWAKGEIFWG